tara:strand:+ start:1491 stop:3122 length:1632 start_codon:yes stop_codon:yes gene_type:complete
MIQNINKAKINLQENKSTTLLATILLLCLFWLKELNFLFYDTLESPDINKYIVYLEHFFNNEVTNKEHGLMYYYLQSLNYSIFYSEFNNFELYIHKSIQQVNFYIFLFGLVGYYKLLRLLEFSANTILATLIFLNFFPPSISMRLVFKPEILAFALLPWIIILFELFIFKKKTIYLYLSIPLIASAVTIKGNVLVIITVYLFFTYLKIVLMIQKKHIILLLSLFFISLTAITLENNSSNGKSILDIQSGSAIESNYDFKASPSVIYKTNMYQLITSPIKHNHADSFVGVTLLETTGDYFDLYWDNDATEYLKNRKALITYEQSNEIKAPVYNKSESNVIIFQQRNTDVYLYESLGIFISIILFFNLIRYTIKNSNYRKYLLAIFFGMGVLLFHSITGIPKNNFDPLVGDTFKPLYYSFVFSFSFAFLIALLLKEKFYRTLYLGLYCLLIVFILGFPKNENFAGNIEMAQKIQISQFCFIEKSVYLQNSEFENIQCKDQVVIKTEKNDYEIYRNDINHKPLNLIFILLNLFSITYVSFNKRLIK